LGRRKATGPPGRGEKDTRSTFWKTQLQRVRVPPPGSIRGGAKCGGAASLENKK